MIKPLTNSIINQAVDRVCSEFDCFDNVNSHSISQSSVDDNSITKNNRDSAWIVKRWINSNNKNQDDVIGVSDSTSNKNYISLLLYGITITTPSPLSTSSSSSGTNNDNALSTIATFYIGYSTWDGRILYLDTILSKYNSNGSVAEAEVSKEVLLAIRILISRICIELDCTRFTWHHYGSIDPLYLLNANTTLSVPTTCKPTISNTIPPPVTLEGWIKLHWYKESIEKFISNPVIVQHIQDYLKQQQTQEELPSTKTSTANTYNPYYTTLYNKINIALNIHQQYSAILLSNRNSSATTSTEPKKKSIVRIRLATTENDCNNICRLVKQLAIYAKEEHAVNIGKEHYTIDGLLQNDIQTCTALPLFFCLLLVEEVIDNTTNNIESEHVFGMAFCYIGYKLNTKNNAIQSFVYLEDFYVEESYRKHGYGTYTMECLGVITLIIQSYCMVWTTLDWNTSAIQFYTNKIGACIQSNLYTTRYDTTNLSLFVDATHANNNKQQTKELK